MDTSVYCAEQSRQVAEPMLGSVGIRRTWILVQDHGTWAAKAFAGSPLPDDVKQHLWDLAAEAAEPDEKPQNAVLLIRDSNARTLTEKRLFLVRSGGERPFVRGFTWQEPEDIKRLPLRRVLAGEADGEAIDDLLLVCTNGSRDRCCAKYGLPLFRKLKELRPEGVWRCSHLGGHRFAATMVWLPHGVYYGRVPPTAAAGLVEDVETGRITLPYLRGRSTLPRPAQVAEGLWRQAHDVTEVDALEFLEIAAETEEEVAVSFRERASGAVLDVRYRTEPAEAHAMPSCGEEADEGFREFRLLTA